MSNKKPGLTVDEHQEVAEKMARMYDDMLTLAAKFDRAFPRGGYKGKPCQMLMKCLGTLGRARTAADENYRNDYPELMGESPYFGGRDE